MSLQWSKKVARIGNNRKLATSFHEAGHILIARRNKILVVKTLRYTMRTGPWYAAVVVVMPDVDDNTVRTSTLRKCLAVCMAGAAADSLLYKAGKRKRYKTDLASAAQFADLLLESLGMNDPPVYQLVKVMQSSHRKLRRTLYQERRALTRIAYRFYDGKRV